MLQVEMKGLSGQIKFDTSGARNEFKLDVVELVTNGLTPIGTWDPENGAQIQNYIENLVTSSPKKNLIVSTVLVRFSWYRIRARILIHRMIPS